ncbi:hypothetical protein MVEN_01902900 [Mycena venus]|uniref:Uncharacterized protein n=1 Tax=Mycena venus TaxID=2733690 RepID=A0A8H6XFZ7_9AGAR|nr:hypothetical protein MVEN_01902900 [Mycena venus]
MLSAPSGTFGGSKSSLIPPESRGGSPFRRPSFNASESPSEDISHLSGSVPMAPGLQIPHFSFDRSSSSLSSTAETDSPITSSPPAASLSDSSFSPTLRQTRSVSSSSRPHRRPRPLSVGSNGSSAISRNTIRGVPHGPHSQVQIVLPAPLAFNNDRVSPHENSPRFSVVDQWAPPAVRSEGGTPIPKSQRRSSTHSEPRRSTSQSSLAQPPINAAHVRRSASASPSSSLPIRGPATSAQHNRDPSSRLSPPPVPQIPQQWLPPSANSLKGIAEDAGRGRPRDIGSSSATNELPPLPVDRPPPTDGQRRLQKRSKSSGR